MRWQAALSHLLGEYACYAKQLNSFASSASSAVQWFFRIIGYVLLGQESLALSSRGLYR